MKINIAGAGAGKTTQMSDLLTSIKSEEGKFIFCVSFTNAAARNIEQRIIDKCGHIPQNIKISTIHSFLYNEFINPYYYFLYKQHFEKISNNEIPVQPKLRQIKLKDLENRNILHIAKIPEKAKWVAYRKSDDNKEKTGIREAILGNFKNYCTALFIDEAQDIDSDILYILESLNNHGIDIHLYGDPKQDIRGFNQFKRLISLTNDITYISECYRCPQKHLNISNTLANSAECQISKAQIQQGNINIIFETEIEDISKFLIDNNYGLAYISKKNERFSTHHEDPYTILFKQINDEIHKLLFNKWGSNFPDCELKRGAFSLTEKILYELSKGIKIENIIKEHFDNKNFNSSIRQALSLKLTDILSDKNINSACKKLPVVSSIESIKGLEHDNCLFILTKDLFPYLIKKKTEDNRTKHLLYVALTRSKNNLTILITKEVEYSSSKQQLQKFLVLP